MKMMTMAALVAAQLLAAGQPALAADLEPIAEQRPGAFGGLRVRLPLGGQRSDRQLRAGLALAPTLHSRSASGESRMRISEGLEFGIRGREPLQLSIAGRDVRRLGAQGDNDRGGGIPTGAWIAGGIVLVAIVGVTFAALALEDAANSPS